MATGTGFRRMRGVAAAPGVARGPWVHVRRRELPVGGRVAPGAAEAEEPRLRDAANQAADDLMALSERVAPRPATRTRPRSSWPTRPWPGTRR